MVLKPTCGSQNKNAVSRLMTWPLTPTITLETPMILSARPRRLRLPGFDVSLRPTPKTVSKPFRRLRLVGHDDFESLVDGRRAVGLDVHVGGLPDALCCRRVRVNRPRQLSHGYVVLGRVKTREDKGSRDPAMSVLSMRRGSWPGEWCRRGVCCR